MMKAVKREVEIVETEGLASLLGQQVFLMCLNYNYYGKLVGVNETCVLLEDAYLVYETGKWSSDNWKDAQKLPSDEWYVQTGVIESFAAVDK